MRNRKAKRLRKKEDKNNYGFYGAILKTPSFDDKVVYIDNPDGVKGFLENAFKKKK